MAANSYKRAVEELDTKTARELDAPYRATVLEPVGNFVVISRKSIRLLRRGIRR